MNLDKCVSPPELDDRQLLMYIDGESDTQVAEHLERCPYCRERSHMMARMQNVLTTQLYRITCPTPLELGDFALGYLSASRSALVAEHLRDCLHCTREVSQLQVYLGDLAPAPKAGPVEQFKVLVARLVGEMGGVTFAPAYATLRGGTPGPITMQADGILILLQVQPAVAGSVDIIGQINADEQDRWTGASVELRQASGLLATASVDDLGTFYIAGVLPGATELQFVPNNGPIVLANIEIVT